MEEDDDGVIEDEERLGSTGEPQETNTAASKPNQNLFFMRGTL